ncbi:hypothetical protein DCC81_03700 [Chitinophaga parva]|uniref:Tetracycline regulation of excision, RteC n=1 Tax=Chitinophaga parva TaxID=2169414 RepID=A0A2T7BLP3_9BACT|nr:RteC domain-containing protein [Chitinophaga parva]PUZ28598.1 hypothetical protein DCC81_03700 [Chitinophaga parva]
MDRNLSQLTLEMLEVTGAILRNEGNSIRAISTNIAQINAYIERLNLYLDNHAFQDTQEEISFFKTIRPEFDGRLLLYVRLLHLESKCEMASTEEKLVFFQQERKRISQFSQLHRDFFRYFLTESTHLDNLYFTRSANDQLPFIDGDFPLFYDKRYYARMSFKIACIHSHRLMLSYLNDQQRTISPDGTSTTTPTERLVWTGSVTALAELIYGLQEYGVFNNTKVEVKKIARYFQEVFGVKIENTIYKYYEDMRIRKKSRTPFFDGVKNALLRRMDKDDEEAL